MNKIISILMLFILTALSSSGCSTNGVNSKVQVPSPIKKNIIPEESDKKKKTFDKSFNEYIAVFETDGGYWENKHRSPKGWCYVVHASSNGIVKIVDVFPVSFGLKRGMKQKAGDNRTPYGFYKVKKILDKPQYEKYAGTFILIDYPNDFDRRAGRKGSEIGIHGGRPSPTNGCLRILDDDFDFGQKNILKFRKIFNVGDKVIIVPKIRQSLKGKKGQILSDDAYLVYGEIALNTSGYTREKIISILR